MNIQNFSGKDIRTLCLSIGGFYTIFGTFSYLMIRLQAFMLSRFEPPPDESFTNIMNTLHDIWGVYMPLMILLGVGYLLFGLFFNKIGAKKFQVNLALSILSLIWVIAYVITNIKYMETFFGVFNGNFGSTKTIAYGFAVFGLIAVVAMFTVPQYIIGKKIRELTENTE